MYLVARCFNALFSLLCRYCSVDGNLISLCSMCVAYKALKKFLCFLLQSGKKIGTGGGILFYFISFL